VVTIFLAVEPEERVKERRIWAFTMELDISASQSDRTLSYSQRVVARRAKVNLSKGIRYVIQ